MATTMSGPAFEPWLSSSKTNSVQLQSSMESHEMIAARSQSACYELGTKKVVYTLDYIILSVTSTFFVGANLYFYLSIQIDF